MKVSFFVFEACEGAVGVSFEGLSSTREQAIEASPGSLGCLGRARMR